MITYLYAICNIPIFCIFIQIKTNDRILEKTDFVNQIIQSEKFKVKLRDITAKVKESRDTEIYLKTNQEILALLHETQMENLSVDQIFEKYCDLEY